MGKAEQDILYSVISNLQLKLWASHLGRAVGKLTLFQDQPMSLLCIFDSSAYGEDEFSIVKEEKLGKLHDTLHRSLLFGVGMHYATSGGL